MKGGESRLAIRNIESGSEKVGASQWEESDFTGAPKQPSPSPDQFSWIRATKAVSTILSRTFYAVIHNFDLSAQQERTSPTAVESMSALWN